MSSSRYQGGQILIIYLTTLFVGGSSLALGIVASGKPLADLENAVEVHVTDDERRRNALDLLEQWEEEGEDRRNVYRDQRERLLDLVKNHASTRDQFDFELSQLLAADEASSRSLLDIQYALRDSMTEAEWTRVMAR